MTGRGQDHRSRRDGRAQLVLVAAVVVAVALAPVVLAYLQLGAHPDVGVEDGDHGADARRFLERATHEAGASATGSDWANRDRTVGAVRGDLAPRLSVLEESRVEEGVAYAVGYNRSAATAWANGDCPGGDGRRFGPCRAVDAVVVQERAGETTVLAVAYDVTVTTPRSEQELTFVVEVVE